MRAILLPCLLTLGVGLFAGKTLAEDAEPEKPEATPKFESLQLVFLYRGDKAVDLTREERRELGPKHLEHLKSMQAKGLVLAGPFGEKDDSALRGLCIYKTKDREEARKLAEADPAVQKGALAVKTATWYVQEGSVAFPKAKPPEKDPTAEK